MLLFGLIGIMVLIWTFNFVIAKVALNYLDPVTLAAFRVEAAGLIFLAVYLLSGRRAGTHRTAIARDSAATSTQRGLRLDRSEIWLFTRLGIFGVALNQMLFTVGLSHTTVGHSALIIGTGPITVLLLAHLMGLESVTVKKVLGMALSFCVVAVLASEYGMHGSGGGTLRGDLITMVGSLAFAIYEVTSKKVAHRYDTLAMNTLMFLFGAVFILPLAVRQALRLNWGAVGWQGWAAMLYMASFASVIAYLIFYWALRHLVASRLSAFTYLQPIIATLLSILLLGEKLTNHLLVGGGLVLVGVYLAEVGLRQNGRKSETASGQH